MSFSPNIFTPQYSQISNFQRKKKYLNKED